MHDKQISKFLTERGYLKTSLLSASKPNDCVKLSSVLETGPIPEGFFLSAKACAGILRRAEKRGKTLPQQLEAALTAVASAQP